MNTKEPDDESSGGVIPLPNNSPTDLLASLGLRLNFINNRLYFLIQIIQEEQSYTNRKQQSCSRQFPSPSHRKIRMITKISTILKSIQQEMRGFLKNKGKNLLHLKGEDQDKGSEKRKNSGKVSGKHIIFGTNGGFNYIGTRLNGLNQIHITFKIIIFYFYI